MDAYWHQMRLIALERDVGIRRLQLEKLVVLSKVQGYRTVILKSGSHPWEGCLFEAERCSVP
jgi:hypothetical protein